MTREEIDRIAPASGIDLLRQVPGLQIDQLGGPGGTSLAYIRGSDPNHVLVLVDGVRVNDPTNSRGGSFDLSSLDPATIERIEILRGPASAIYGPDAMGGVINVISRTSALFDSAPLVQAAGGFGSRGFRSASVSGGGSREFGSMSLSASDLHDGQDQAGGALHVRQVGIAARLNLSDVGSASLIGSHVERSASAFPDDSGGVRLAKIRTLETRAGDEDRLGATGMLQTETASVRLLATHFGRSEDDQSPGVAPGTRRPIGIPAFLTQSTYLQQSVALETRLALGQADLVAGVSLGHERSRIRAGYILFGRTIEADVSQERSDVASYSEVQVPLVEVLKASGGLRFDRIDGKEAVSPSVGLVAALPDRTTLRSSVAKGFKPPSFFALGLPAVLGGNAELRPEHSVAGTIGVDHTWRSGGAISAAIFNTRYRDLVTFDNRINRLVNADRVTVVGIELEASTKVSAAISVRANFTRQRSRVSDSDERLRQRPGRRGGFEVAWDGADGTTATWRTEYSADTFDSSIPTGGVMLAGYLRSDVAVVHRLLPTGLLRDGAWSAIVAIDNVFDRKNENYVGQTSLRRRFRIGLRANL